MPYMQNFTFSNPTKIVFGEGQIKEIAHLVPANARILLIYGGGSIKKNGVYDQVVKALEGKTWFEFSGIEPNPHYETLMQAVELVKKEKIDFLLPVGGGSVIDGTKLIAAAVNFAGNLGILWPNANPFLAHCQLAVCLPCLRLALRATAIQSSPKLQLRKNSLLAAR